MSDQNINTLQKIKKFSRFITTKVKEKTLSKSQNEAEDDEDDEDELFQDAMIVRRHSSYIYQPTKREDHTVTLKQDLYQHYHHTLPPNIPPTTSALSPPPRQMRSKIVRADNDNCDDKTTNVISKPCLSRSNTLGHHTPIRNAPIHHSSFSTTTMSSSSSSFIMTSPPSSTSLSSLTGRCNVNHTLIN
ncbi:hypothetical protein PS15m_010359 [Mucor circinelloides]